METKEIDRLVQMIDGRMEDGVGRLSVAFSEKQPEGTVKEKVHYGRRDAWNPWNWGEIGAEMSLREDGRYGKG